MRVILLYLLAAIMISNCAVVQNNEHSSNLSAFTPNLSIKTSPTPNSTLIPPPAVAEKLANRTSTRLELSQMKKMKLDQQPTTIAKTLFNYEGDTFSQKKLAAYAKKTEIYVSERDLNQDGVAERIVYDAQVESPGVYVFKIDGKKWKFLFANSGDITTDARTYFETNSTGGLPLIFEFLSSGVSGDFDILKTTTSMVNNYEGTELSREVEYFLFVKDGGYLNDDRIEPEMLEVYSPDDYSRFYLEGYQCPVINLKVDESQPCFSSNREDRDYLQRQEQREKRKAEEEKENKNNK
jgi:hypothetical protein